MKIKVFIINPKQSHNFAKAISQRNKSDKTDAKMLSLAIMIAKDDHLLQKYKSIFSIDGIGKITAIILIYLFIKYPNANQGQITSLVGLDTIIRESGTSIKGKSSISKAGGKIFRGTLFMAAMVATNSLSF